MTFTLLVEVLIVATLVLFALWTWWNKNFSYWKKRGFPYIPAKWPFGTFSEYVFLSRFQGHIIVEAYKLAKGQPYVGLVIGRRPHLLITTTDMIKTVMLKDFNNFTDRANTDNISRQPTSKNLFALSGEKWRSFRFKLTPGFSSGKMKLMFTFFERCADQLEQLIASKVNSSVDMKDVMSRFTTDVIASCAFGLDTNSMVQESSEVQQIIAKMFPKSPSFARKYSYSLHGIFPGIEKYYRPNQIDESIDGYIAEIVSRAQAERQSWKTRRNDFLDILMDIKKSGKISNEKNNTEIEVTEDDLVAQVFMWLAAGYETSSSVSTYCLYELAKNTDIQDKLRLEIDHLCQKYGGLTYQALMETPYLDQAILETMRKYPTVPVLTRKCTADYRMPDRPDLVLEKDIRVLIPTWALHRDPELFPDPMKYDPERFSPENKDKIVPFSFLPFGEGPRLCIGMRFGMMQVKTGVATIIRKFRVIAGPDTPSELVFSPSPLISVVKDAVNIRIEAV